MPLGSSSLVTRRGILQTTGAIAAGTAVLTSPPGATVSAQPSASITFNDQESDGQSIVIASAHTSVKARLLIVTGRSTVFRELELDAGTEFTDRTIELTEPLQESQRIRAELRTADGDDELLARDRALIAVNESLESARSTLRLSNGSAELIDPNPKAGFFYPYLLYTPQTTPSTTRLLYVHSLNEPAVANRSELRTQVTEEGPDYLRVPDQLGLPALIPAFPRTPDDGPSHIQGLALPTFRSDLFESYTLERIATEEFPARSLKRVDKQLLQMIADARQRLESDGYTLADRIHMNGFSASAQFAARFAFLHPGTVGAISIGGNGAYPLPKESMDGTRLPYPLGTADYQQLTGREFDRARWTDIDQFIYVGQEDQPLPSTDQRGYFPISQRHSEKAIEVFGQNRVTERLPVTKSVYQDVGANATFQVYEGVGHEITSEMTADIVEFHRSLVDRATPTSETAGGTETPTGTVGGGASGFGFGAAIAGLTGLGYLLKRRINNGHHTE